MLERVQTHTQTQTHTHTRHTHTMHTHTHTQNDYRNPCCACTPRLNSETKRTVCLMGKLRGLAALVREVSYN